MYVTQQDIDDFAEYDSQGIRCFMTGANRFEYSGILKLKKKTAGKFFVFFFITEGYVSDWKRNFHPIKYMYLYYM